MPTAQLQRSLRPFQFLTIGVGTMIGVGWAIVLSEWMSAAGPVGACLGFILGGLAMTLVALCYAELATALPRAGGEVVYALEIFGERTAFAIGWFIVLGATAMTSFEGISMGWFIDRLFPGLFAGATYTVLNQAVRIDAVVLGIVGSGFITLVNYHGARGSGRLQDVFTVLKACAVLAFMAAAFFLGRVDNLAPAMEPRQSGGIIAGILSIVGTAPLWMSGFQVVPQAIEERSATTHLNTIGWVTISIVPIGIVFYSAVILAAGMSAPWHQVVADPLPARYAIEAALGHGLASRVVLFGVVLGIVATWNACFLWAARLLFGLAREGLAPSRLGLVNRYGAPGPATVLIGSLGTVGVALGRGGLMPLVNVASIAVSVAFCVCCCATLRLRRDSPHLVRPFRVWGGEKLIWVAIVVSAALALVALAGPLYGDRRLPIEWILIGVWGTIGLTMRRLFTDRRMTRAS